MKNEHMANGFRVVAGLFDAGETITGWMTVGALVTAMNGEVEAFAATLNALGVTVHHDQQLHAMSIGYRMGVDGPCACRCGAAFQTHRMADKHLADVLREETFGCL